MEAEVGIEPALTELQSAAWPLCHSALFVFALEQEYLKPKTKKPRIY